VQGAVVVSVVTSVETVPHDLPRRGFYGRHSRLPSNCNKLPLVAQPCLVLMVKAWEPIHSFRGEESFRWSVVCAMTKLEPNGILRYFPPNKC
jgi:hypothetical protein